MHEDDFESFVKKRCLLIENKLRYFFNQNNHLISNSLNQAIHYALFSGGKRMRGMFCMITGESFQTDEVTNQKTEDLLTGACLLECLHTYSLIHDDLPCMDNADCRRGIPSLHKKFNEYIALLAGDALLTETFLLASKIRLLNTEYTLSEIVRNIAELAGKNTLISGQMHDMEQTSVSLENILSIYEQKTASLIILAIKLAGIITNLPLHILNILTEFGKNIGIAFQIIDDIVDLEQDRKNGNKKTYPLLVGVAQARETANDFMDTAYQNLDWLKDHMLNNKLYQITHFFVKRI